MLGSQLRQTIMQSSAGIGGQDSDGALQQDIASVESFVDIHTVMPVSQSPAAIAA